VLDQQNIIRFYEAISNRNSEFLEILFAETAEFYFPKTQPLLGKERIMKFLHLLWKQYPVLVFDVKHMIIQGNKASAHWTNKGVNRKKQPYENEGVTLFEWEGDTITYISDFFKDTEKF
jgi:ketosteroid isomerase-like protein